MDIDFRMIPAFGVAGNFTGHLEQAGEARDFAGVAAQETSAPKAVFPTYIPRGPSTEGVVPDFLTVFPFDGRSIALPAEERHVQIEPECAVLCDVRWHDGAVADVNPVSFCASNDCSIRKEGVPKISRKKNWGACSKGLAERLIPIDSFRSGGILDRYRIASFLIRGGEVAAYGEDSAVRSYSYIYERLLDWLRATLNSQQDAGPMERVSAYLAACGRPPRILVSIGATRYTDFGTSHFLQDGDESVVILYPDDMFSPQTVAEKVRRHAVPEAELSVLWQTVRQI